MKTSDYYQLLLIIALSTFTPRAAVITVTTTNNPGSSAQISLLQALTSAKDGDSIQFNIPGPGPHYIATPAGGYPLITKNNVTIDGYTQPGSSPNTNSILAPNNAKIMVVLDSRNGNSTVLDFAAASPNDDTGYGDTDSAIFGILQATGIRIQGFDFIGVPLTGAAGDVSLYAISLAKGASAQISGCWIGVDLDGKSLFGPAYGITGFRYRIRDENSQVLDTILINDVVVGVDVHATNAPAQFNVFTGIPAIPINIEGNGTRISGNFINVFPDGLRDYDPAFDPNLSGNFQGNIEIGRGGNNTIIGTDGDGINDSNERNIIGGAVPASMGGYAHNIEFYGQTPGTNIVIAGNYIGIGVDGQTRFTNGVPVLNASGGTAQYRFGSDFNGVSDNLEGNVLYNNWPPALFPASATDGFFDQLTQDAIVSARGNVMVNNNPYPVSPNKNSGADTFYNAYYAKALTDVTAGVIPILLTNTSATKLVGRVPIANTHYPVTIIDLYTVDPEGMSYGKDTGDSQFPNGFIQGKTYIASFVEGSAADKNPKAGDFEFDISQISLPSSLLAITANYSQEPAGSTNSIILTSPFSNPVPVTLSAAPKLSVSRTGPGITLSWTGTGFTLESSPTVIGPWTPASTTGNSYTTTPPVTTFFRLHGP